MDVRVRYRLEGTEIVLRPWIFKRGRRPIARRIAQWAHPTIVTLAFLAATYSIFHIYFAQPPASAVGVTVFAGLFIFSFTAYFVLPAPSDIDILTYFLLGYRIVGEQQLASERRTQTLRKMDPAKKLDFLWKEYMAMLRGGTPYASISWKRDRIVPYLNAKGLAAFEHEEGLAMAAGEAARQQQDQAYQEGFMTGYMLGDDRPESIDWIM